MNPLFSRKKILICLLLLFTSFYYSNAQNIKPPATIKKPTSTSGGSVTNKPSEDAKNAAQFAEKYKNDAQQYAQSAEKYKMDVQSDAMYVDKLKSDVQGDARAVDMAKNDAMQDAVAAEKAKINAQQDATEVDRELFNVKNLQNEAERYLQQIKSQAAELDALLTKYKNATTDTDGDGVNDEEDKCINEKGPASNFGCPVISEEIIKRVNLAAKNVFFATASDKLLAKSFPKLNDVVTILNENPSYKVQIDGHTDAQGKDEYNQDLSDRRAASVKAYLAGKGIAETRLSSTGYGETKPVADNNTAAGRAKNRRVEMTLSNY